MQAPPKTHATSATALSQVVQRTEHAGGLHRHHRTCGRGAILPPSGGVLASRTMPPGTVPPEPAAAGHNHRRFIPLIPRRQREIEQVRARPPAIWTASPSYRHRLLATYTVCTDEELSAVRQAPVLNLVGPADRPAGSASWMRTSALSQLARASLSITSPPRSDALVNAAGVCSSSCIDEHRYEIVVSVVAPAYRS